MESLAFNQKEKLIIGNDLSNAHLNTKWDWRKLFPIIMLLLIFNSCSTEIASETDSEILNAISLQSPLVNQCTGYGLFVDTHGQLYDCGWKRGYQDWVYHYNSVASFEGFDACSKLIIGLEEKTKEIDGTKYVVSVKTVTRNVDNSPFIISQTKELYKTYYDNLTANRNKNDFYKGMFAGYNVGRNQVPYAADPKNSGVDCNDGGSPKPFDWGKKDDDNDGISNDKDQCPKTPGGEPAGLDGCSQSQRDDKKEEEDQTVSG